MNKQEAVSGGLTISNILNLNNDLAVSAASQQKTQIDAFRSRM